MEAIYAHPRDYDLEHEGDDEEVNFYVGLLQRWRPQRIMELASGSGRIAIPLAESAAAGTRIVGLERPGPMLDDARRKHQDLSSTTRERLVLSEGDMRDWRTETPFDLVLAPCSSLSHLQELDEQLAAWQCAYDNLRPGGRFVADLAMPNLPLYADSLQTPPRAVVEIDIDARDPETGTRLLRYKTTRYLPHTQQAAVRFLYDRFPEGQQVDRYVSDFDCHVYYPREVELLFRTAGFLIECWFGDYSARPFRATSRQMIAVGRRPESIRNVE